MEKKIETKAKAKEHWMQVTEIDIVYRNKAMASERPKVSNPRDLYNLFRSVWNMDTIALREEFKVMFLNHGLKVLGLMTASIGGITSTVLDVRLLFATALKARATKIALAHNHPSGTLVPSMQDKLLTRKIKDACALFDIVVMDHIILSGDSDGYYSMSEEGEL